MTFYFSSSADYRRLQRSVAGDKVLLLAKKSVLVGQGPDCWYSHSWLYWAAKPAVDAGDNSLHAAAFGRGPEPRTVGVREVSTDEAARIVDGKCSIDLADLPDGRPPLDFTKLHTYRCVAKNGHIIDGPFSVAAWCDAALVELLAQLDT